LRSFILRSIQEVHVPTEGIYSMLRDMHRSLKALKIGRLKGDKNAPVSWTFAKRPREDGYS
jgi:hypothetical protein